MTNRREATGSLYQLPACYQTKKMNAFKGYHDAVPVLNILTHTYFFFAVFGTILTTLLISPKYNQQDATFSPYIYFNKLLYMFQAVPPPIIRSTKLYIQRQVLSNQYCCRLLSWMRWNVPPPIIRSTKLYIQRQVLSNQYCCLVLSWMRWNLRT